MPPGGMVAMLADSLVVPTFLWTYPAYSECRSNPSGATATNGQYPIVIFDRAELDAVCVHFQQRPTLSAQRPMSNAKGGENAVGSAARDDVDSYRLRLQKTGERVAMSPDEKYLEHRDKNRRRQTLRRRRHQKVEKPNVYDNGAENR